MAFTVTATFSGEVTPGGGTIRVTALLGAKPAPSQTGGTGGAQSSSSVSYDQAVTVAATGSVIYGAASNFSNNTAFTADSVTTFTDNVSFASGDRTGTFRSTSATSSTGSQTFGASAPTGTAGTVAAAEILAATTITEDSSTSSAVTTVTSGSSVTSPSFTPPPGSLLVVRVAGIAATGPSGATITDTSGLGLTWTALRQSGAAGLGADYAGVFIAQVPGVSLDAVGPSSSGFVNTSTPTASPQTWTHVVAASATHLFVWVVYDGTSSGPPTVTVTAGGTSMTPAAANPVDNNGGGLCYAFTLKSPPTGTITISVSATGGNIGLMDAVTGGSLSFNGSGTLGTPVVITGTNVGTSMTLTVTGVAATSMVAAFMGLGDPPVSPSAGASQFQALGQGSGGNTNGNAEGATAFGTGSVAVTWSGLSSSDTHAGWAVEVQAAGGGSSPAVVTEPPVLDPPGRCSPLAFRTLPVPATPFPPATPPAPLALPPGRPPGRQSPMAMRTLPVPQPEVAQFVFDSDASHGADGGELVSQVVPPHPVTFQPPGRQSPMAMRTLPVPQPAVPVSVTDSDSCTGADGGEGIVIPGVTAPVPIAPRVPPGRLSPVAFPRLPVPQSAVAVFVFDSDASHGTDAGELISLSSSDSSTESDNTERAGITDSDSSSGADGAERAGITSSDSSSGADGGEVVQPESSDTSSGSDGGFISLSDSDSGAGAESGFIGLSSSDSSTEADGGEGITSYSVVLPPVPLLRPPGRRSPLAFPAVLVPVPPAGLPVITDSDHCQGIDSGFSNFSDSDGCTGTETNGFGSLPFSDSDACSASEHELTAWPHDSDSCSGLDGLGSWYTVASGATDSDACHSSDASATSSYAPSDSDACAGAEGQIIDVYTYQPPFRWTGGQYELRWHGHVVWRGERPDAQAYVLGRHMDAGTLHVVRDLDSCQAAEDEAVPPQVMLVVARAITVLLSVAPHCPR